MPASTDAVKRREAPLVKASAIIALAGVLKVSTDFLLGLCNGKEAEP